MQIQVENRGHAQKMWLALIVLYPGVCSGKPFRLVKLKKKRLDIRKKTTNVSYVYNDLYLIINDKRV